MRCPSCMAENAATRRFCAQCGAALPVPCPVCGFENETAARFCGGCGRPVGEIAAQQPATPSPPPRADAAERRQLTVMFCDLVGSTALSARFDPEELREDIRAYQNAVSAVVARYDGFVAKFMGDGVLAYFGYPQAHEDDAERAVRAGLEIEAAVASLESRGTEPLAVRIGIATGLVVVGDLVGEGSAQEQPVVGETPNLAARLQALAEPGQIVLAGATRRLIGDLFRLRDLGRQAVKGFAEPVDRLRQAWSGAGQIVLLSGEAGIGKSRLAAEVANEPHTWLRYQCSPYHRDSVLHPFVVALGSAARLAPDDPPETQLDKLEAILAPWRIAETAPLFASLLSIPTGDRCPPLALSPAQQGSGAWRPRPKLSACSIGPKWKCTASALRFC
jgi:class 3 adenylate cyclase